ncbi:MAG: MmcQ/YjbR family DNA-binding protein [Rhizobiaceae bacterium]
MNLTQFNDYCGNLPATEKVIQWGGAHVWKVGGKIFAIASRWGKSPESGRIKIGFKASDMAFMMLTEQPNIEPSPYLGRYKWVQLQTETALEDIDIKAYIEMAHKLVTAKLTKVQRKQLNL